MNVHAPVDLLTGLVDLYVDGLPRGDSTGWFGVDKLYTVKSEQWTCVTGIPGMGKSEWLDALIVNLVEQSEDWKFCIYSPENFPVPVHLAKLVEKHVRKPLGRGPTPRMTRDEATDAGEFLTSRIRWLDPKQKHPEAILELASQYRYQSPKFGVILDNWAALEHLCPENQSETKYVSQFLTTLTNYVRELDCHVWVVSHPTKLLRDKDGNRPVPAPYDIAGSAHWYNKADNIIAVHRDQADQTQDVQIHVQKVRFKYIGQVGMSLLKYDKVTGRYFEPPYMRLVDPNDRVAI